MAQAGVVRLGTWIVNWYAVEDGGRWTVFDAAVPGHWSQLAEHGIRPDAVEAVVLTHAHVDHVGVADRLREAGATVYVHEDDERLATTGKPSGKNERSMLPYLRHPMAWRLLVHLGRAGGMKAPPIGSVTTFRDGEVLDVPGRPRVLHTPGHTDGHAALHLEDRDTLVAGDLLCTLNPLTGARGPQLMPSAFNRSDGQILDSLGRIEDLDVGTILVGHGEPWTEGAGAAVDRARSTGPT